MRLLSRALPSLGGLAIGLLYFDAVLRLVAGLFGDGFGPVLGMRFGRTAATASALPIHRTHAAASQAASTAIDVLNISAPPGNGGTAPISAAERSQCTKHELLLGNLYADLAPWVDRQLHIGERQMRDAINYVGAHRGRWDSWVTDTLTPVLITGGRVYLTLGPPSKDPSVSARIMSCPWTVA